ncbi:Uncharacterised protein [Nocardia farcinica]|uniref:hypothetical protein n=1 Tax=Nocardia farcinica TaxID=37329 RepID=UPI000DFF43FA|nr:hypothetical protein [Nocardia farcinica]SUE29560.1 Uncharacterised protein [Nocardia farcinica]
MINRHLDESLKAVKEYDPVALFAIAVGFRAAILEVGEEGVRQEVENFIDRALDYSVDALGPLMFGEVFPELFLSGINKQGSNSRSRSSS